MNPLPYGVAAGLAAVLALAFSLLGSELFAAACFIVANLWAIEALSRWQEQERTKRGLGL